MINSEIRDKARFFFKFSVKDKFVINFKTVSLRVRHRVWGRDSSWVMIRTRVRVGIRDGAMIKPNPSLSYTANSFTMTLMLNLFLFPLLPIPL